MGGDDAAGDPTTKDDIPLWNTGANLFVGDGSTTTFQLLKSYQPSGSAARHDRDIVKPKSGGIKVAIDTVLQTDPGHRLATTDRATKPDAHTAQSCDWSLGHCAGAQQVTGLRIAQEALLLASPVAVTTDPVPAVPEDQPAQDVDRPNPMKPVSCNQASDVAGASAFGDSQNSRSRHMRASGPKSS